MLHTYQCQQFTDSDRISANRYQTLPNTTTIPVIIYPSERKAVKRSPLANVCALDRYCAKDDAISIVARKRGSIRRNPENGSEFRIRTRGWCSIAASWRFLVDIGNGRADGDRHEDEESRETSHRPGQRHPRAAGTFPRRSISPDRVAVIPAPEDARSAGARRPFSQPEISDSFLHARSRSSATPDHVTQRNCVHTITEKPRSIVKHHVRFDGIVLVTLATLTDPRSTDFKR